MISGLPSSLPVRRRVPTPGRRPEEALVHPADMALPRPATLRDAQLRGVSCVWCAEPLDTSTAVDLGTRPDPACPWASWFPRACPLCFRARL